MAAKKNSQTDNLRQQEEIFGILLMTLALLVLISLVSYDPGEEPSGMRIIPVKNAMGVLGVYISYYLIKLFIGYSSIVVPFLLFAWGWNRFKGNETASLFRATVFIIVLAIYIATILGLPYASNPEEYKFGFEFSGLVGGFFATMLNKFFGVVGSIIVLISLAMVTIVAATQFSFEKIFSQTATTASTTLAAVKRQLNKVSLPSPGSLRSLKEPAVKQPEERKRPEIRLPMRDQQKSEADDLPLHKKLRRINQEQDHTGPSAPESLYRQDDAAPPTSPAAPQPAAPKPAPEFSPLRDLNQPEPESEFDDLASITVTEREDIDPPTIDDELPKQIPLGNYIRPSLELLDYPEATAEPIPKEELLANARQLEQRLEEFGVLGHVVEINPGPVITRYEFEPAPGIKVSKITGLSDDLALSMRAKRIRIVAPIPGKAAVGIELPNKEPQFVYLRSILDSENYVDSTSPLTIALGKTISGKPYVAELNKMPHLLVAGSTGSGKSVCLNTIIASILFKAHPTEVKFVLIDPKRLELGLYKRLCYQHLIYREDLDEEVVTTPQNALAVLRSLEFEMEQRYDLFATAGVRNIEDYNQRVKDGRIKGEPDNPATHVPYIVVVIDELADLMLTAAKEVEEPIARLTQMARAIGIHLIVATQRPSVDVITGVIKANFPARIAFAVASKTDSRTILDMNGAEKLLGKGDMLFLPPGSPELIRLHGPYMSTEEVERVLDHIYRQPKYPRKLLPIRDDELGITAEPFGIGGQRDELFKEALKLVVRHQQGSISLLQRRLKVGYARAARLIDELEAAGIVGGFDGSKAREVLIDEEQLEHLDWDSI